MHRQDDTLDPQDPNLVWKIAPRSLWEEAERQGQFDGASIDLADGFIHFSTAAQLRETAAKHFAGQDDLLLIAVDGPALGPDLAYEPSRGGDLFPHLYAPLPLTSVRAVIPLPRDAQGNHIFPEGIA